jgi:hypothetical protein
MLCISCLPLISSMQLVQSSLCSTPIYCSFQQIVACFFLTCIYILVLVVFLCMFWLHWSFGELLSISLVQFYCDKWGEILMEIFKQSCRRNILWVCYLIWAIVNSCILVLGIGCTCSCNNQIMCSWLRCGISWAEVLVRGHSVLVCWKAFEVKTLFSCTFWMLATSFS